MDTNGNKQTLEILNVSEAKKTLEVWTRPEKTLTIDE